MAQVFRQDFENGDVLALWHISEELDALLKGSTDWQREYISKLGSPRRKQEWLSWQMLLRGVLGEVSTDYRSSGAPYIIGSDKFISVSHCKDYAAILISGSNCAIDIEPVDRDFSKAQSRFLMQAEQQFSDQLGLVWGAKETVFKYKENNEIDMLKDILVSNIEDEKITVSIEGECLNLNYINVNELNIVYLLKNKQSY